MIVGLIGIVVGYYGVSQGIRTSFLNFIGDVGYALSPIPAIIIADYYVVHRMHYPERLADLPAINWRAIAAFVVTLAINIYLGVYLSDVFWRSVPLIGFVLYLLFSIPELLRNWRQGGEPAPAAGR